MEVEGKRKGRGRRPPRRTWREKGDREETSVCGVVFGVDAKTVKYPRRK
jgi:hypothetical protein